MEKPENVTATKDDLNELKSALVQEIQNALKDVAHPKVKWVGFKEVVDATSLKSPQAVNKFFGEFRTDLGGKSVYDLVRINEFLVKKGKEQN